MPGSIAGCDDKNTKEEDYTKSQYTSLTVDYDKQKDAQTYIGIAYDSKYLSKEQKAIIAKLDALMELWKIKKQYMNSYTRMWRLAVQ